jgi:hypothetical protein
MWKWLQENSGRLDAYDFKEAPVSPGGPVQPIRFPYTLFNGSMAYSFTIARLHIVMLQDYPAHTDDWWEYKFVPLVNKRYVILNSFDWLTKDLRAARTRGEASIVFTHSYEDKDQFAFGTDLEYFNKILCENGVAAVFCGHMHEQCGKLTEITEGGVSIPVFRSGAASQQDFLLAEIDLDATPPAMTVYRYDSKTISRFHEPAAQGSNDKTTYIVKAAEDPGESKWTPPGRAWQPEKEWTVALPKLPQQYLLFSYQFGKTIAAPENISGDTSAYFQPPKGRTCCFWTMVAVTVGGKSPPAGFAFFRIENVAHPGTDLQAPSSGNGDCTVELLGGSYRELWLVPIDSSGLPIIGSPVELQNVGFTGYAAVAREEGSTKVTLERPNARKEAWWIVVSATG